jgi:hypothetical protein
MRGIPAHPCAIPVLPAFQNVLGSRRSIPVAIGKEEEGSGQDHPPELRSLPALPDADQEEDEGVEKGVQDIAGADVTGGVALVEEHGGVLLQEGTLLPRTQVVLGEAWRYRWRYVFLKNPRSIK